MCRSTWQSPYPIINGPAADAGKPRMGIPKLGSRKHQDPEERKT